MKGSKARGPEVSGSVRRELWRLANGMCQMCRRELDPGTAGRTPTAQTAHNVALSDHGPRANPTLPIQARNAVSNLLLLCSTCHDIVDKNNGKAYTVEELFRLKAKHETWTAALRKAGQAWRMSYSSVDYLNVPRVAMLPGGDVVQQAAQRAGLDPTRPFSGQGFAPGMFVGTVRPVFESWREHAVPLDEVRPEAIQQGMYVAFNAPMRSHNVSNRPFPRPLTGAWQDDPYLSFRLGGRRIMIRYDPQWLTTSTAGTDLVSAAAEQVAYAGIGLVVGESTDAIRISALFFGKPQTAEGAFMKYVIQGEGQIPRAATVDDFDRGLSSRESGSRLSGAPRDPSNDDVTVALHFNELEVDPGQIQRETFRQLMRVVPEFRRDLTVAVGTLFTHSGLTGLPKPLDIAAAHLAGEPKVWSTHSISGLGTLLAHVEVAFALVRGVRRGQLDDLHQALLAGSESYLGAVEVNLRRPTHQYFYDASPRYRLIEADLRLLYSAQEYYGELGDWDHRPHELLDEWESEQIFKSVAWEEDKEQSAADERQAEEETSEWMAMINRGEAAAD
ncbi:HNH endonuclease [Streptomyces sp. NBC_00872]|uniref:HNH endonuclease n=1 Tax=Streptomyces sp. NBC_00872 TaxID=2903686 RepID=UPI00386977AA|nr:HNH endonuclease [Streptomyces sp. NBC_00872]